MDKSVGTIIYEQLGGARFVLMTGARGFLSHPEGRGALSFTLPSKTAKNGINHVKITLTAGDTYDLVFTKVGPQPSTKDWLAGKTQKVTVVSTHTDIYAEQLQSVVAEATGLALTL